MRRLLFAAIASLALLPGIARAGQNETAPPIATGAFIHNSYQDPGLYDAYARQVGRGPAILGSYKTWAIPLIDRPQLEAIWGRGAVPLLTWEPWGTGGRDISLRGIARGRYDAYLRRSARDTARWGKPVLLRFAQEMNGTWYPWGRGRNGNTPRLYVAAWRHIVRVFRAAGADNVKWVWVANQNTGGRFPFRQYYPGDHWVDWVGLDGFNWSLSPRWQSFDSIFARSYNSLVGLTAKPVMIAETGSWEHGGRKAAWVRDALTREAPQFGHLRALVWWSVKDSRGDLRVDSSATALRAARNAIGSPLYSATRADVLGEPRRLAGRGEVAVPSSHGSLARRLNRALKDNYAWVGLGLLVLFLAVLAFAVVRARHRGPRAAGHKAPL
jgi:mannan endo-1,4-beta-mannosidase